jgi:hypothetical protein
MPLRLRSRLPVLGLLLAAALPSLQAAPVTLTSPVERTMLVELYTSEGCSSCPPADRWLSSLRDDPRLWREMVPVAFHVDYWDYIGWPDRFATAEHGQRQRAYAADGRIGTVYTPGFVIDGQEWRGWFQGREPESGDRSAVGVLALELDGGKVAVRFDAGAEISGKVDLHLVLLGFDLASEVRSGENAGRTLQHDFVVLDYQRRSLARAGGGYQTRTEWRRSVPTAGRYAVAAWVTPRGGLEPLQAVGGWLPTDAF